MWWLSINITVILLLHNVSGQTTEEDFNTDSTLSTTFETPTTESVPQSGSSPPITIEILRVYVIAGIGNAVKLIWGKKINDVLLNITYGVHYAEDGEDLTEPKLLTSNTSATMEGLDFCTKYNFAVSVRGENKINPNNIRSVVTYLDRKTPPQNLRIEFEPRERPCLLIKWSASCANVGPPIGYVLSAFDHESSHYRIVTMLASSRVDLVHYFKVDYGAKFDIKVSTNFPGSKATETVTYKVPNFLQPYRVRVTSNPEAGAFMIYWQEPYVPYFVDRLYYEVHIYRGLNVSSVCEKYYVTRPVLVYKGNETLYTFRVGSVSYDGQYRSMLTDPIAANIYGDVHELDP